MNNQQCVRDGKTSENIFCKTQNVKKMHFEYGFGNDEKYKEIKDKGSEEPQVSMSRLVWWATVWRRVH